MLVFLSSFHLRFLIILQKHSAAKNKNKRKTNQLRLFHAVCTLLDTLVLNMKFRDRKFSRFSRLLFLIAKI